MRDPPRISFIVVRSSMVSVVTEPSAPYKNGSFPSLDCIPFSSTY